MCGLEDRDESLRPLARYGTLTGMSGSRDLTSREAVTAVEAAVVRELGWYPREPPAPDYGIDLYVEAAVDGRPNGRMLAMQIKGGASFFTERTDDGVVFRGEQRHLDYWLVHSLPVVVVLYDPDDQMILWQAVTPETAHSTGEGWRLVIPRAQRLDASSAGALEELVEGDPYTLRLNALRADLGWMRLLRDGGRIWVEAEEWVNKSLGRGSITLIGQPRDDREQLERQRAFYLSPLTFEEMLSREFPWANVYIDEDFYTDEEYHAWEGETGRLGIEFEDWREVTGRTGLRPFEIESGEVARWRLVLDLNELGRGVLLVDEFLSDT
jgi:hypothetical protein